MLTNVIKNNLNCIPNSAGDGKKSYNTEKSKLVLNKNIEIIP